MNVSFVLQDTTVLYYCIVELTTDLFQSEASGVRELPELALELSRSCVSLSTHSSSSNLSRSGSHSSLVNNSLAGKKAKS